MAARRTSDSKHGEVIEVIGGCYTCHGLDVHWRGNALGVAARHHQATGHPTWAEQTIRVRYGAPSTAKDDPLTLFPADA